MVRTKRSIEEEARVRRVSGQNREDYLANPEVADLLEGEILRELFAWGTEGVRRALVVGLEDQGRIALELVKTGVFVTVVEPDESLHEPVLQAAGNRGIQLNFYASDYMKRDFASSGFDMAIFYSTLASYNEPLVVLKKAARELRAGGRVFARVRVRPTLAPIERLLGKIPHASKVTDKIGELVAHVPSIQAVLSLPDGAALLEGAGEIFKIERSIKYHLIAPVIGQLGVKPNAGQQLMKKALPLAIKVDNVALKAKPLTLFATHLAFFGSKELGLGKTFKL